MRNKHFLSFLLLTFLCLLAGGSVEGDWIKFLFVCLVIAFISAAIAGTYSRRKSDKEMKVIFSNLDNKINNLPDFTITEKEFNAANGGVLIDEDRKKVCIIQPGEGEKGNQIIMYNFNQIISCEMIKDGQTVSVTKASTSSLVGRGIVGGLAFGGTGALLGGLTGKKTTSVSNLNRFQIMIILNDLSNPTQIFNYAHFQQSEAERCYALLKIIINRMEGEDVNKLKNNNMTIYEELEKLANLRDKGIITEEEFQLQKSKILKT